MTGQATRTGASAAARSALYDLAVAPAGRRIPGWVQQYVGIPFAPKGYDRQGLNCWGLVCLVYAEQRGIELPHHAGAYDDALLSDTATLTDLRRLAGIVFERRQTWRQVAWWSAEIFDVVLMPIGDALCHVGIYVGDLHVLHVESGADAACEDLRFGILATRIGRSQLYRYEAAP